MSDIEYTPREALAARFTSKVGTELEILTGMLQKQRAVAAWKVDGIDSEAAKRSVVDSLTTLLGLLHHLAWVEAWWFQGVFAGEDVDYPLIGTPTRTLSSEWGTNTPSMAFSTSMRPM